MLSLQHCQTVRLADEGQEKVTRAMGLGQHWSGGAQAMRGQADHHPDTFTLPASTAVNRGFVGDGSLLSLLTMEISKPIASGPLMPLSAPWISRM